MYVYTFRTVLAPPDEISLCEKVLQEFDREHVVSQHLQETEQAQAAAEHALVLFGIQQVVATAQCIVDCDTGEEENTVTAGTCTRNGVHFER